MNMLGNQEIPLHGECNCRSKTPHRLSMHLMNPALEFMRLKLSVLEPVAALHVPGCLKSCPVITNYSAIICCIQLP